MTHQSEKKGQGRSKGRKRTAQTKLEMEEAEERRKKEEKEKRRNQNSSHIESCTSKDTSTQKKMESSIPPGRDDARDVANGSFEQVRWELFGSH